MSKIGCREMRVMGIVMMAIASIISVAAHSEERPVQWSLAAKAGTRAVAGKTIELQLTASIDPEWHVYGMVQSPGGPKPLQIRVAEGQTFTLAGTIVEPEAQRQFDETFKLETAYHEDRATFRVPIAVAVATKAGTQEVKVTVRYQACSPEICRPPATETVTLAIPVQAASR
jgi:Thiol:disulfide interchange protein DsbD, N-terminal